MRTANLLLLLFEFFPVYLYTYTRESLFFFTYIFYLFSFLLSFIIFVYYVLIFFVGREENKKPLSNLEKCSSPIPRGVAVKKHLNSQEVFLQTRFIGVFVATSKKGRKWCRQKLWAMLPKLRQVQRHFFLSIHIIQIKFLFDSTRHTTTHSKRLIKNIFWRLTKLLLPKNIFMADDHVACRIIINLWFFLSILGFLSCNPSPCRNNGVCASSNGQAFCKYVTSSNYIQAILSLLTYFPSFPAAHRAMWESFASTQTLA